MIIQLNQHQTQSHEDTKKNARQKEVIDLKKSKNVMFSFSLCLRGFALAVVFSLGLGCRPAFLIIPSYIKTVGVAPTENKTSWFGLDIAMTQNLIQQFQLDGRVGIEDPDRSDMVVKVIIKKYSETPQSQDPKTNAVLQYLITLDYDVVALDHVENKTLSEYPGLQDSVYYYTTYNTGAIPQTRDQALQQLEQDMARLIVLRVMQGN
jgi:hypothetical protein